MDKVYICAFKVLGYSFAVLTEEEAKQWVSEEPGLRYYHIVPIKKIETPQS